MPPRLIILAIVLFWLATSAWLFHRDLWPRLRSDDPPPFTIDLADEARGLSSTVRWSILRKNTNIGTLETSIKYSTGDNTFQLHSKIPRLDLGGLGFIRLKVHEMESIYRVTQEGVLREIVIRAEIKVEPMGLDARLRIEGKVDGGWFKPHGYVGISGKRENLDLEPVPVSQRGTIINALHPVNRIRGLRRGQHWRVPMVDPLADSLYAMVQKDPALQALFKKNPGAPTLQAEVLLHSPQLQYARRYYGCLVIEYRGDNIIAHTWVRESDGLVLKQEATYWGDQIILERN